MKNIFLLISILTITTTSQCQNWEKEFKQELFESLGKDSIYISDRKQLEEIKGQKCTNNTLTYSYISNNKDSIEIKIERGLFEPSKHDINLIDTVYKTTQDTNRVDYMEVVNLIDNIYSYGIDASMPTQEIKSLSVIWNNLKIVIPDSTFANLYQPHICFEPISTQAFISENGKNIYLYICGSDGAGGYSVKFVFDQSKFVTRIITTNEMTDGFDYLDATAKYED